MHYQILLTTATITVACTDYTMMMMRYTTFSIKIVTTTSASADDDYGRVEDITEASNCKIRREKTGYALITLPAI